MNTYFGKTLEEIAELLIELNTLFRHTYQLDDTHPGIEFGFNGRYAWFMFENVVLCSTEAVQWGQPDDEYTNIREILIMETNKKIRNYQF